MLFRSLLALENTITGRPISRSYLESALSLARKKRLSTHLDGARVFNAAVHEKTSVNKLCAGFDSVSSCLSKGLGTPAGTMLLGSKEFLSRAHRARKILGGGMRQAGVIAAAGLYALEHNVERLAEDHANAERLAKGLREAGYDVQGPNTNMVMVRIAPEKIEALKKHLESQGVKILPRPQLRLVTHLDVSAAGIDQAVAAFRAFACS